MYDSTNPAAFPMDPAGLASAGILIAGYVDGKYAWPEEAWQSFLAAGVTVVNITINPANFFADVLDIEPGNYDALDSVAFTRGALLNGSKPTVYCGSQAGYSWGDVINAHLAAGVLPPAIWWSNPNGDTSLPAGVVARQYSFTSGANGAYDISSVADYWPGVDAGSPADLATLRKYAADASQRINSAIANDQKALESLKGW